VRLPIEDSLDLHTFRPSDVAAAAAAYLDAAAEKGLEEVRLIHGRGIGQQRDAVRRACARHPAVLSYGDATPERGGWGATVVRLRPPTGPAGAASRRNR
jgi:DNA-nicking Smr family endonuclease